MPKVYRVVGDTSTGMKFVVEVVGERPYDALEKVYSLLGSRHKLRRTQIRIREVSVVEPSSAKSNEAKMLMVLEKVVRY